MASVSAGYDAILARFRAWAMGREDLRAAFVLGSRARRERPADEWSDLDLLLLTTDPGLYLDDAEWVAALGTPWLTFVEGQAVGEGRERRVLFAGGLDVDFAPIPVETARAFTAQGWPPEIATILRRGVSPVVDKDGLASLFESVLASAPVAPVPSEQEFSGLLNDLWYHVVWTTKKLRRGELWTALECLDGYLQWRLLALIRWHARATHGPDYDTWHAGRFIERWADPRAAAGLREVFARYEARDVARALLALLALTHTLGTETAARLGYAYPAEGEAASTTWVRAALAGLE
ncbi:MAG TPA: aminoglycoside 6-adenylyltransferase [Ktedonobacterales bacterium]